MCFVEHGVVPIRCTLGFNQRPAPEALDRTEEVIEVGRLLSTAQEVSKRFVTQYMTEPVARLAKQLFTMSQKQKPGPSPGERLTIVVEGGNQSLAGTGGCDDQVPEMTPIDPFGL